MEFCELSFRSAVAYAPLRDFLATVLRKDRNLIGQDSEYWDRLGTDHHLEIGVEVKWSDIGYKTFLKWVQDADLPGSQLFAIAFEAAKQFATDVALGDFMASIEATNGSFLVFTHDLFAYNVYDVCNRDQFELNLYPSPLDAI